MDTSGSWIVNEVPLWTTGKVPVALFRVQIIRHCTLSSFPAALDSSALGPAVFPESSLACVASWGLSSIEESLDWPREQSVLPDVIMATALLVLCACLPGFHGSATLLPTPHLRAVGMVDVHMIYPLNAHPQHMYALTGAPTAMPRPGSRWRPPVGAAAVAVSLCLSWAPASASEQRPQSWPRRLQDLLFGTGSNKASAIPSTTYQQPEQQQEQEAPLWGEKLGGAIDAWATDTDLRAAQRLLDGDHQGLLGEMISSQDLDVIWSDPIAARRLLEANPILEMLPGVAELAAKAPEDFTPQDVRIHSVRHTSRWHLEKTIPMPTYHNPNHDPPTQGQAVLGRFRAFIQHSLGHAQRGLLSDAGALMETMEDYAARGKEDPEWARLFAAAEGGDKAAAMAVHDRVFDDLWGGVLDKAALGFGANGGGGGDVSEAPATAKLRARARAEEPALWDLMTQGDELIDAMLTDPMMPMKMAQALTAGELEAEGGGAGNAME